MFAPIIFTLLCLTLSTFAAVPATNVSERYCRYLKGVSVCVSSPLKVTGRKSWCEYHICGPSFVRAEACPVGEHQATHLCMMASDERKVWQCHANIEHERIPVPVGCELTGSCKNFIIACRCVRVSVKRVVYKPLHTVDPTC